MADNSGDGKQSNGIDVFSIIVKNALALYNPNIMLQPFLECALESGYCKLTNISATFIQRLDFKRLFAAFASVAFFCASSATVQLFSRALARCA